MMYRAWVADGSFESDYIDYWCEVEQEQEHEDS